MKKVFILIFTLIIIISCKNNSTTITDIKKGNLQGEISLYNGSNATNAKVFIQQANLTAYTDSTGTFLFKDLPEGTYDIYITKDGYDSTALFSLYFPGYFVNINNRNIDNNISVPHTTSGDLLKLYDTCMVETSLIISNKYLIKNINVIDSIEEINILDTCWQINTNYYLKNLGFKSGQKLFLIAYSLKNEEVQYIKNTKNSRRIWMGLSKNPSNVESITMP